MKPIKLLATLAVLLGVAATPAHALKLRDFDIAQQVSGNEYPAIRVKFDKAADNWTIVTGDMVDVSVKYHVEVEAAYALANSEVRISLDGMRAEEPLMSSNNHLRETHTGTLRLRKPGNQLVEIKDTALEICKTIRGNGGKPNKEHRIERLFTAHGYIEAYTTATWFTEGTATARKLVRVDVICEKDPTWHEPFQPSGLGLSTEEPDFRVLKLDLFLTTYENQYTTPSPGRQCKKLHVKVRIETSKAGQLSYKIWRQPGEDMQRVKFVSHQTSGPFKGRFVYEEEFVDTFSETTYAQYMVEAAGSPVGVSTPWKAKHIICTSPGGGGLTLGQGPGPNPADELPAFAVTDANVLLQKLPGNACPARVRMTTIYRTNMPGAFDYHVGCTNGFTRTGKLEARTKVGADYVTQEQMIIDVAQTGELTCSARPIKFGHELAVRKLLVQCASPPPGIRATPRPSTSSERR